ncbi:MAG: AI-2E family transporter [Lachnospiraceae bacterium]|nr:AI-2E family transporter [Lachnospiraceae bacterium]
MKFKLTKEQVQWGITAVLVVIVSLLFYKLLFHGETFTNSFQKMLRLMAGVIVGFVLAYIMSPLVNLFEAKIARPFYAKRGVDVRAEENAKQFKRMRFVSVVLALIVFFALIYAFVMIVIPQLYSSIRSIVNSFPRYYNNIYQLTDQFLIQYPEISDLTNTYLEEFYAQTQTIFNDYLLPNMSSLTDAVRSIGEGVVNTGRGILNFFIGIVVSVYLLNSKEVFCGQAKKIVYALFKENVANEVVAEARFIHYTFVGFLAGKIVDSIIIGILCYIGTKILQIPYPLLISVVVGVTNIIPVFGPYIGGVFGCFLVLMVDPMKALILLVFILLLQQLDGNIIGPMILGNSTGISTFWVLFSILLFGGLFGLVGWIIGVPLFAVIYSLIARFVNHKLSARDLPVSLPKYIDCAYIEGGEIKSKRDPENVKYRTVAPKKSLKDMLKG